MGNINLIVEIFNQIDYEALTYIFYVNQAKSPVDFQKLNPVGRRIYPASILPQRWAYSHFQEGKERLETKFQVSQ